MRTASVLATSVALACLTLTACTSDKAALELTPSAAPSTAPMDLKLLVFNVEYGGTKSTDRVIRDLDADVVGVLESYNRLPAIAKAAGYPYYDVGLQLLSNRSIRSSSRHMPTASTPTSRCAQAKRWR
ncbi:MAG: hypothetical protein QM655_01905 [Nocardioidaceae bacterium]